MSPYDFLIPIASSACIAIVLSLFFFFRYRSLAAQQETIRKALEHGAALTPELVERLGQAKPGPEADFRRGVVSLAFALGIASFALILGEEDALRPLLAISSLPGAIGVAFLVTWRYRLASGT